MRKGVGMKMGRKRLTFGEVKKRCNEHPFRDKDDSDIMSRCRLLANRTAWVFGYGECKARFCPKWGRILSLRRVGAENVAAGVVNNFP